MGCNRMKEYEKFLENQIERQKEIIKEYDNLMKEHSKRLKTILALNVVLIIFIIINGVL